MKKRKSEPSQKRHLQGSQLLEHSPSHLLHRVLQIALDIYAEETGENALTQRQFALLLATDSDDGMTQTELVRYTGIDRSTLADMVARMITKGLLVRERSTTDARANVVRLSDAGRAALVEMQPKVGAADERILSLLSPPKRESFLKLLRKIAAVRDEPVVEDEATEAEPKKAPKAKKGDKKKKKVKAGKKSKEKVDIADLPMPELSDGADDSESQT